MEVIMVNSIKREMDGTIIYSINEDIRKKLNRLVPVGCRFKNYSMFDLLVDWITMYDWIIYGMGEISLVDFIEILKKRGYATVLAYGDAIINILKDNNKQLFY